MNASTVHPEELFDKVRVGRASPAEVRILKEHVASCTVCRCYQTVSRDLALDRAPPAVDVDVLARAIAAVEANVSPSDRQRADAGPRNVRQRTIDGRVLTARRAPRSLAALVAIAVLLMSGAAAAVLSAGGVRLPWSAPLVLVPDPPADFVPVLRLKTNTKLFAPKSAPPAPSVPEKSPDEVREPPSAPAREVASASPSLPLQKAKAPVDSRTSDRSKSAALFHEASELRYRGNLSEAIQKHRELLAQYPASREAPVSRVSLARILLDRGAAAEALALFDAYLAGGGGGTLEEEALLGRAVALRRLGRVSEERAAWERLIARRPGSVHVTRAKERLEALH